MLKVSQIFILQSTLSCDNESKGYALQASLTDKSLKSSLHRINSIAELQDILCTIASSLAQVKEGYVIHFDTWCNEDGLALVDRDDRIFMIDWQDLGLLLQNLYKQTQVKMIVAFSRCPCHGVENLVPPFLPCPFEMVIAVSNDTAPEASLTWYIACYQMLCSDELRPHESFPDLAVQKKQLRIISKDQLAEISWTAHKQSRLDSYALREMRKVMKREILAQKGFLTGKERRRVAYQTSSVMVKKEMKRHLGIFFS